MKFKFLQTLSVNKRTFDLLKKTALLVTAHWVCDPHHGTKRVTLIFWWNGRVSEALGFFLKAAKESSDAYRYQCGIFYRRAVL
jgi:hypothetical protein